MADVSDLLRRDADEDRAQIILITGLTLAVLLVAVVLLLNTVIYTENLATRGADAGGAEAIEFRDDTVDDLAGILEREHRNASSLTNVSDCDGTQIFGSFNSSARAYDRTVADFRARDATVTDLRVRGSEAECGYFIAQNETASGFRELTDPNGTADWTVASDANRTRNFRLTVDNASLAGPTGSPFTVVADSTAGGTNETWSVTLVDSGGDLNVTVDNGTTTVSETFEPRQDGNHTVDLTGGTVNGEPFDALVWAEGVQNENGTAPFEIRYKNGSEARGTYSLVVDGRDGSSPLSSTSRPYVVDAVYGVDVEIRHRTPELTYGDVVRLAPGERDA
ncbi:hypothetical protein ABNG03_07975 [Halorubrum sp. RMP-47]|uniref:Uncharacterized protein n=1 Tax=Halorubrum miltondacostae TaxID=3076378 RepID=A0ABD5M1D3_9EURY